MRHLRKQLGSNLNISASDCSPRTKHIGINVHLVQDYSEKYIVNISLVPTSEMAADMFTKPVQRRKLEVNRTAKNALKKGGMLEYSDELGTVLHLSFCV